MEDYTAIELALDDPFTFDCHVDVPCFNDCCGDLTQMLTPWDVLCLKNGLGLSSADFLAQYTHRYTGGGTGLVVVSLNSAGTGGQQCPFVTPQGCQVYACRPGSCRSYPLARMASISRETGQVTERYWLMKEPHCRGFEQGPTRTVREWVENQGLAEYNETNDLMMPLIRAKNRWAPGRALDLTEGHIFYTGCYDLDRFRDEYFEKGDWQADWFDAEKVTAALTDERALLEVALVWVRKMLFPQER